MNRLFASSFVILFFSVSVLAQSAAKIESKLLLREGWSIQSSEQVKDSGDLISTTRFNVRNWYPTSVPSTVVGALVENKVYADPLVGKNLRLIPGCRYPIGANFSNIPMPDDSPFRVSWWYRTQFQLPLSYREKEVWLHFDGINFRANIWLNGKRVATSDQIAGTFRIHELNIKGLARPGSTNTLAVEVFPSQPDDLAWTWVDWNPSPPDKNLGIFRDVYINSSGPVTVRYPQVMTRFDLPSLELAHLTINAEVENSTDVAVEGILKAHIDGVVVSQPVKLEPHEDRSVTFTPDKFRQLNISKPRVWWPLNLGSPELYSLNVEFLIAGKLSDHKNTRFGIREISSELDSENHRLFKVNGRNVLIRGGGWSSDIFLRSSTDRLKSEFRYVKDMNLNTIRLEGQLQSDYFFDLADEEGILIMAGWCCCSHWEHWEHGADYTDGPTWDKEDFDIAARSLTDQIKRLRSHPSLLVWLNGSDNPPPANVEQMYVDILKKYYWPNPYLSSATAKRSALTGVTGVKMEGPYEWVPASYWLLDKKFGGAHGFATEISPGPAVPPVESLRKMLPADHLWPIDDYWNYHAGGGQFKNLEVFSDALTARYGPATGIADYALKSQLMAYEGQRAMFEAYGGSRYASTGVIQWMLNNAWPSMIWHLYDYYLMPGGGYFGTKKACEPVHVQYSYDDKSIVAVNTTAGPLRNLKVTARVYDLDLKERFSKVSSLNLPEDSTVKAFVIPPVEGISSTYFLKLTLEDQKGVTISSNFYWLSTKDDVLDWQKSTWYYTPTTSVADMTKLSSLQPATLKVGTRTTRQANDDVTHVTVSNTGNTLAFFIHLQVKKSDDREVLPIVWQDNYFSLLPGEVKEVTATYKSLTRTSETDYLLVDSWNSPTIKVPIGPGTKR